MDCWIAQWPWLNVEEWNTRDLLRLIDDTGQTLESRASREVIASDTST